MYKMRQSGIWSSKVLFTCLSPKFVTNGKCLGCQMGIGCFAEFADWPGAITRGRHDGSTDDLIHQADVNAWSAVSAPGVSRILITTSPTPQPLWEECGARECCGWCKQVGQSGSVSWKEALCSMPLGRPRYLNLGPCLCPFHDSFGLNGNWPGPSMDAKLSYSFTA